ncbi:hypothetical protein [Nitrospira sp. Nam74]
MLKTSLQLSIFALTAFISGCMCQKSSVSLPTIQPLSGLHAALKPLPAWESSQVSEFEQCSVELGPYVPARGSEPPSAHEPTQEIILKVRHIESVVAQHLRQDVSGSLENFVKAIGTQTNKAELDFADHHKAFLVLAEAAQQLQPLLINDEVLRRTLKDQKPFIRLLALYQRDYFGSPAFKGRTMSDPGTEQFQLLLQSGGFVDRNGNSIAFPTWSLNISQAGTNLSLSSATVNSGRISSDLTRLFVEAFFDSIFYVPAQPQSSAVIDKLKLFPERDYPTWDTVKFEDEKGRLVTSLASDSITFTGTQAEAFVTAAMGKAIRGGLISGLNNETLAAAVETAAGVTAKKLVEHEVYCYFKARYKHLAPDNK